MGVKAPAKTYRTFDFFFISLQTRGKITVKGKQNVGCVVAVEKVFPIRWGLSGQS